MTGSLANRRRFLALFSSTMLSIVACHRPGAAGDTPDDTPAVIPTPISAQLDSVRGTLLLVGNEPVATLLLAAIDRNSEPVAVTGALMPVLRRVIGLEIVLFGHKTGARAPDASPRGAPVFDVHSLDRWFFGRRTRVVRLDHRRSMNSSGCAHRRRRA